MVEHFPSMHEALGLIVNTVRIELSSKMRFFLLACFESECVTYLQFSNSVANKQ